MLSLGRYCDIAATTRFGDHHRQELKMPTYKAISLAAALLAAALVVPGRLAVAAGDPFEELMGDWKGGGTVVPSSGGDKTVACKVTYTLKGTTLTQHLRCAGEDYNINSTAKMTDKNGKIRGSWTEITYDANGGITGTVRDDTVHAKISGDKFSSRMSIEVSGDDHTINIVQLNEKTGIYRQVASLAFHR
jgi:hypothetical protein